MATSDPSPPTADELAAMRRTAREARSWAGRALRYLDPRYGPVDVAGAQSCARRAEALANNLRLDLDPFVPITPMSGDRR